jgi:putative transposase
MRHFDSFHEQRDIMAITRSKIYVPVHFVWATHDRLPLVATTIESRVYDYIAAVCRDNRCRVIAIGGMPDHIHLLAGLSATMTMSKLIKDIKGGSSRFISEQCTPGEWFAWQAHYAAFAVSPTHVAKVAAYIGNQKRHHAEGTLWPAAEQTHTEEDGPDTE